jgi:hypothetical protein
MFVESLGSNGLGQPVSIATSQQLRKALYRTGAVSDQYVAQECNIYLALVGRDLPNRRRCRQLARDLAQIRTGPVECVSRLY